MHEHQQTSYQGWYSSGGGVHNSMEINQKFVNLVQATVEDCADVTNLMMAKSKLSKQVALYANCLSTKESDNEALQISVKTLQVEVNNLK